MKEIKQEFEFKFGDATVSIKGSSINRPWMYAKICCGVSIKEIKEFANRLLEIANQIENDKDFRNK